MTEETDTENLVEETGSSRTELVPPETATENTKKCWSCPGWCPSPTSPCAVISARIFLRVINGILAIISGLLVLVMILIFLPFTGQIIECFSPALSDLPKITSGLTDLFGLPQAGDFSLSSTLSEVGLLLLPCVLVILVINILGFSCLVKAPCCIIHIFLYVFILTSFVIIQLVSLVLFLTGAADNVIKEYLITLLVVPYKGATDFSNVWNLLFNMIMFLVKCCGVEGYLDFRNRAVSWTSTIQFNAAGISLNYTLAGCWNLLAGVRSEYMGIIAVAIIALCLFEVLMIVCAIIIIVSIRKEKKGNPGENRSEKHDGQVNTPERELDTGIENPMVQKLEDVGDKTVEKVKLGKIEEKVEENTEELSETDMIEKMLQDLGDEGVVAGGEGAKKDLDSERQKGDQEDWGTKGAEKEQVGKEEEKVEEASGDKWEGGWLDWVEKEKIGKEEEKVEETSGDKWESGWLDSSDWDERKKKGKEEEKVDEISVDKWGERWLDRDEEEKIGKEKEKVEETSLDEWEDGWMESEEDTGIEEAKTVMQRGGRASDSGNFSKADTVELDSVLDSVFYASSDGDRNSGVTVITPRPYVSDSDSWSDSIDTHVSLDETRGKTNETSI